MEETRDAVLHLLTPEGAEAGCEWFGLRPVRFIAELAADGVWQNLTSIEVSVSTNYPEIPAHMGFSLNPQPWVEVGGLRMEIPGFEPVLISMSKTHRISEGDILRYAPGQVSVVAESLSVESAA